MSREPLSPLPPDVVSLLARTRPGVEPPPALRVELRARLGPALEVALPTAATTPLLARVARHAAAVLSKKGPLALVSFGLGAGTGATVAVRAVHASAAHVAAAHVAAGAPAAVPVAPSPLATVTAVKPTALASLTRPARSAPRPAPVIAPAPVTRASEPAQGPDRLLAAERVLIEKGRSALARGDAAEALAAAGEHAHAFPQGALREERDALRIQALMTAGRRDEAAQEFVDFARTYPRSMLTPALRRALQ